MRTGRAHRRGRPAARHGLRDGAGRGAEGTHGNKVSVMRHAAAAIALALLLTGCPERREVPVRAGPTPPADSIASIRLQHAQPAPAPERLPLPRRKPAAAGAAPPLHMEQLIGLDQSAAADLLGQPALQHERPPAKVWTYNAEACELSLFFYADINTRVFRALTYEFKSDDQSEAGKQRCLAELVRHHET